MAQQQPPSSPSKRTGVMRKVLTGVVQPASTSAVSERWKPQKPSATSSTTPTNLSSAGAVVHGSVRDRARAYEQRCVLSPAVPYIQRKVSSSSSSNEQQGIKLKQQPPQVERPSARPAVLVIDEQHLYQQQSARQLEASRAVLEPERPLSAVSHATRTAETAVPAKDSQVQFAPAKPSPYTLPTGAAALQRDVSASNLQTSCNMSPEGKRTTRAAAFQVDRSGKRQVRPVTAPAVSTSQALRFAHSRQNSDTVDGDVEADARFASRIGENGLQIYDEPKSFRNDSVRSNEMQSIRPERRLSTGSSSTPVLTASADASALPSAPFSDALDRTTPVSTQSCPVRKRANTNAAPLNVEGAFADMLVSDGEADRAASETGDSQDDLQLPETVRQKMLGLDIAVKRGMLAKSSPCTLSKGETAQRNAPYESTSASTVFQMHIPEYSEIQKRRPRSSDDSNELSADVPRSPRKRMYVIRKVKSFIGGAGSASLGSVDTLTQGHDAKSQATFLLSSSIRLLKPDHHLKTLRIQLRNESPTWVQKFIQSGGYAGLMARLHDVLAMEWREEQHDDKILLELLRCFRALLMTHAGQAALASCYPAPFVPLVELLFSEKKPGDLATRQCMIDLVMGLFVICGNIDSSSLATCNWRQSWWPNNAAYSIVVHEDRLNRSPLPAGSVHQVIRRIMTGPADEKVDATLPFMRQFVVEKPLKLWMNELVGVLSDYFWIFCHSGNKIWRFEAINEEELAQPKVPGGMTGGVEYEAMEYCTAHLQLLNQLIGSCPDLQLAHELHNALYASGFDRILLTLRKSSQTYYPRIHLELARYAHLATQQQYETSRDIVKHLDERRHGASPTIAQSPAMLTRPSHKRAATEYDARQ